MKLKLQILLLLTGTSAAVVNAQTEYGDGSMRLNSTSTHAWDDAIDKWIPQDSAAFKYLYTDKPLEIVNLSYNKVTTIHNAYLVRYKAYDNTGFKILEVDSYLNSALYTYSKRLLFTKNNAGNIKTMVSYYWDKTLNDWALKSRNTYTYNSNGLVETNISESYDILYKDYVFTNKDSTIYNPNNKVFKKLAYLWDNTLKAWFQSSRDIYTYNTSNKETYWSTEDYYSNNWHNRYKYEIVYAPENERYVKTYFTWNVSLNSWEYNYRQSYNYRALDSTKIYIIENWNATTKAWDSTEKNEIIVNAKGWDLKTFSFEYNQTYKTWLQKTRFTYQYNSQGYRTYRLYETFDNFSKVWKYFTQMNYYYDAFLNAKPINRNATFKVYPNPVANQQLYINCIQGGEYRITDLQGKTLQGGQLSSGENTVALNLLPSGLYLFTLNNQTVKILKTNNP